MVEKEAKKEHEMKFAPSPCPGENHACQILVYNMYCLLFKTLSTSISCNT